MANELMFSHTPASGLLYDVLLFNAAGQVDAGLIQGFQTYTSVNYQIYANLRPATELGDSGVYMASMEPSADVPAGYYRWVAKRRASGGSSAAETDPIVWQETGYWDGTAFIAGAAASDPLLASVPGSYAQGTAGYALGRIGTGTITTVSPVASGGRLTLVRGDSYTTALGRALEWTDEDAGWPVLTGASIYLRVDDGALEKQGLTVTETGANKKVKVELSGSDVDGTSALDAGVYDYTVVAVYSADTGTGTDGEVTLVSGKCELTDEEGS